MEVDYWLLINVIGATATPMLAQFFEPKEDDAPIDTAGWQLVQPEDIARGILFLLSDQSSQISGINMTIGPGAP